MLKKGREIIRRYKPLLRALPLLLLLLAALLPDAFAAPQQHQDRLDVGYIRAIALSPDGKLALSGSFNGTLRLWNLQTSQHLRVFPKGEIEIGAEGIYFVAFLPGGDTVLAASPSKVWLWNITDGANTSGFSIGGNQHHFALSADGKTLISAGGGGIVNVWNVGTCKLIKSFALYTMPVEINAIALSPDGRRVLASGALGLLTLSDIETGKTLHSYGTRDSADYPQALAVSPDGKTALAGGSGGSIKIWDLMSGQLLRRFEQSGSVNSVALSPDGKTAATGGSTSRAGISGGGILKLWDVAAGKELRAFAGHPRDVLAVAFTPDGRHLLSGGYDATLKLWDVATGAELRSFPVPPKSQPARACARRLNRQLVASKHGIHAPTPARRRGERR